MPSIRQKVGGWISGQKAGGNNWFLDWLQIAADEDAGTGGISVGNAYTHVAWVNIAVCARARNLARAPLKFYQGDGDTEVESGPVYDLFAHEGSQLWEATEGWRCLRGEAIWLLGWGGQVGLPQQIVIVDPTMMNAKLSSDGRKVDLWVYDNRGVKIPFKPEEVIHFPMWNPYDAIRGMPELTPVMDELNQEYLMSKGTKQLMENQSIPGGIITIPGDEMSEEQATRVIEKWEKKHRGINRAGRVAVLGSGATYEKISLSPQEMQSFETRGWNRDTILAKFGVPHAVVGLKNEVGSLAGKDTAEQMKAFWALTLIPELNYFEKKLEEEFFTRYNIALNAEFDTTELWEMQADEELLSNRVRLDVATGVLTINEARELKGMDPVEWGDTWWKPMALVDVSAPEPEPAALSPFDEKPSGDEKPPKEEPVKSIHSLFAHKGRPSIYTPEYKEMRWKSQYDPITGLEIKYTKALRDVFYRMRQDQLHKLMEGGWEEAIRHSKLEAMMGEPLWDTYWDDIRTTSKPFLASAVDTTGKELLSLFSDIGIDAGISWSIWDTRAAQLLDYRVNQGSLALVPDTLRTEIRAKLSGAIGGGWTIDETADVLRDRFNIAQNRATTIARTELGGAVNDSRIAGFKDVGINKHEWSSSRDERVRDSHKIDGEIVEIGQRFSNGLMYPNDPGGEAKEIINCRCLSLPVFGE